MPISYTLPTVRPTAPALHRSPLRSAVMATVVAGASAAAAWGLGVTAGASGIATSGVGPPAPASTAATRSTVPLARPAAQEPRRLVLDGRSGGLPMDRPDGRGARRDERAGTIDPDERPDPRPAR